MAARQPMLELFDDAEGREPERGQAVANDSPSHARDADQPTGTVWLPVIESCDGGHVQARALAGNTGEWFEGHFPGLPILPGVAVLALVERTLRAWMIRTGAVAAPIREWERVRFRTPVSPGTTLSVEIHGRVGSERLYDFTVKADGRVACTGMLSL